MFLVSSQFNFFAQPFLNTVAARLVTFVLFSTLMFDVRAQSERASTTSAKTASVAITPSANIPNRIDNPAKPNKPSWDQLNPAQQAALAPLVSEWDKLSSARKNKWLEIANRFPSLKSEEQNRVQNRMRDWVKLSPDQRRTARLNYQKTQSLSLDEKKKHWQQYQQLPDTEKRAFAQQLGETRKIANPPSRKEAAKELGKPVPVVKNKLKVANQHLAQKTMPSFSTTPQTAQPETTDSRSETTPTSQTTGS